MSGAATPRARPRGTARRTPSARAASPIVADATGPRPPRARTAHEREAGFTLVEMLVVLAILAVTAAASGMVLSGGRDGRAVTATAERLAADLARTRIDAIRSGEPRALVFDGAARSWQRQGAPAVALEPGVLLDLTTAREARALAGAGRGGTSAIAFLPDGRSTGGRVDIRAGTVRRSLQVEWLTGAVRSLAP